MIFINKYHYKYYKMEDNENFCCPITTEKFTDPVIIPDCGHTFDRPALREIPNKRCPTCNADFIEEPDYLPTNWLVASCLDLSIKKAERKKYTASQARNDAEKVRFLEIRPFYEKLLDSCKLFAKKGGFGFRMNSRVFFGDIEPETRIKIFQLIETDGYTVKKLDVRESKWDYRISW